MQQVKHIRDLFVDLYVNNDFVTDKTGVKTIELVGSSFIADETAIFGKPNHEYINREIAWYNSQSLSVNDIPGETPAIWQMISSKGGMINSNYGYLVFSEENGNQYRNVLQQLLCDTNSRRAVMIYQRPSMHKDFSVDEMSDFICTNGVQYVIRENEVHAVVQMRSNDVVFGYRNDYAWQKYVLDKLVNDLNILGEMNYIAGNITWQVGSLHVYERHFSFIESYICESTKKIISDENAMQLASSAMGDA
tara:strand:+ start:7951 stop:8697 length:747 start_codon:yes stop_codon:yes gene_type:complete